ncbi:ExbD/TolR family protein [Luteimonas kalidii]|jgi:biopolymer transport protein ExbD|uniref:Biopolymer transporter ExbD n=1 Tax=Luteimonas kalidii TaxID=3042025 RepID=A0ABT6JPA6_9GAMM|nr:biopolymer transporter ExbD [Luteimonas kalidii]MDH5832332.1 biopolymer transporter ExbD [Luteimonas kalidii]
MALRNPSDRAPPAMAEINIIPLCDVLLVLLIIFMVTAPALSHQIDLDLPQDTIRPVAPPDPVDLTIDAAGQLAWNGNATDLEHLPALMREAAGTAASGQPLLRIDASGDCDYQAVASVLAAARNAGLTNIGFVRR